MNILIIGSGGREHAIASALLRNPQVEKIFLSASNGASEEKIIIKDLDPYDFQQVDAFIRDQNIYLTIIGPEDPLNAGIVDFLQDRGHRVFGPKKKSAILEGSKLYAKEFMEKYSISTAKFKHFNSYEQALSGLDEFGYPTVIKANGLCQGKGVYICQDQAEAKEALKEIFLDKIFKDQGASIVLEQYLQGFEASLLCFVSGSKIYPFDTAMDYKKIYEGDLGPNTGGVGAISPNPYWNEDLQDQSRQIIESIEKGLEMEDIGFSGILFIGYLVQDGKVYVLEFNTRFGDPETEVLLPRLKSDLLENIEQAIDEKEVKLEFEKNYAMATILCSKGYPRSYEKGFEIKGLESLSDQIVFHNGTKKEGDKIYTKGGRVLSIVALADSLKEARHKVYENIEKISFDNMTFRRDIGLIK
ncbi:MAG: phosphoribosylamine--glycine ligase [Tissierellia bacterium]|nr:phosphoribosylamine--glycine ligase [Tissierellia bacterium]